MISGLATAAAALFVLPHRAFFPSKTAGGVRPLEVAPSKGLHGLTGKIEPSNIEEQLINRLAAALKERYSTIASEQSARLIDVVLTSHMRVHRTYDLIEERIIHANSPKSTLAQKRLAAAERTLEVQSQLIEMTGDKRLGVTIPRLISQLEGFSVEGRQSEATKLLKLAGYAQRFRGQRDRALVKLERMLKENFPVPDLHPSSGAPAYAASTSARA